VEPRHGVLAYAGAGDSSVAFRLAAFTALLLARLVWFLGVVVEVASDGGRASRSWDEEALC
jgi:hypothetical protein